MIPLIPALVLAFLSFIASAFVILRIIIPILPPHPLSQRVSPAEFGLPRFRALSIANKGHIWLAALDLIALSIFVWQAVAEAKGAPLGFAAATDPASSIRIWIIMSIRQTSLLIITAVALLYVRLGRSVSFGKTHWLLWAPTMLLVFTSTAFAGTFSGVGIGSLFIGLAAYSSTVAILTTVAFACLIRTLYNIKRNLATIEEEIDPWPPVKQMEEKPRPSFATEEIDAIKDGASWITSHAGSRRGSVSNWSFSTHHTVTANSQHGHGRQRSQSSLYGKSSQHGHEIIPPVPPLPSPYATGGGDCLGDPDPFRRDVPTPVYDNYHCRQRLDSQTSWLTSSNGSQTNISAWSYPTTPNEGSIRNLSTPDLHTPLTMAGSRSTTPALADAQVLGGYGYAPGSTQAERGLKAIPASSSSVTEVTTGRILGWLVAIWLPFGLGFPYLGVLLQQTPPTTIVSILLVLSVTLSSPILALNIIFHYHLPIPVSLFESQDTLPAELVRGPSRMSTLAGHRHSYEYKRSMSTSPTIVEGRRSGDVWISKGDAVDGKNKFGRAIEMLSARPKLSVLPPEETEEIIPPVPIRGESPFLVGHNRSRSDSSAQFGRTRKESKTSSHLSGADENLAFTAKVMIAQRHYSTLAQTVVISNGLPEERENGLPNQLLSTTTGIALSKPSSHLRTRSVSVSGPEAVSPGDSFMNVSGPPPSDPLPPTPPKVRAARLAQLGHKKSFSSGFSFGAVDNVNEIDALTAGVLPLLVPGLNIGDNMKIKDKLPGTWSKSKSHKIVQKLGEFGEEFSSPEFHSTPAQRRPRNPGEKKQSNKKKHLSLPSLGLGKEGVHSLTTWSAEIKKAIDHYTAVPSSLDIGRRNTVFGADAVPNHMPAAYLHAVMEEEEHSDGPAAPLARSMSTLSLGLRADVPHNIDEGRHSPLSLGTMLLPTSAASTVTLFEDFEPGFGSGPQAESTPHNSDVQKPTSKHPPPLLPLDTKNNSTKSRSSIIYIKSDEDHDLFQETTAKMPCEQTTSNSSAISSFAQWSTRAVRPLIPKTSKLQRNGSGKDIFAGKGLRPLELLQDRNTNAIPENPDGVVDLNSSTASLSKLQEIRPLTLGKKQKLRPVIKPSTENRRDENSPPSLSSRTKSLKPLKLARSDTARMRGVLRKNEILPDVVIRPPSIAENASSYVYNYRD